MRKSGVLLGISSLPSEYGIGCFSKEAYDFVDFLEGSGMTLWQILPLGPTGYGDSPYQSFSTFAGNPYFIDLKEFIDNGWLTAKECAEFDYGHPEYVEYEVIYKSRTKLLKKAFDKSGKAVAKADVKAYEEFVKANSFWLEDYALYMAIKKEQGGVSWLEWDKALKSRAAKAISKAKAELADEIAYYYFEQFYFAKQWLALKKYANDKGIEIVGDIPIYVALDGADTWANPELFQLDEECNPIAVAGCPPDYFSESGQLWGNPLYKWDYHKDTGYKWWIQRMAHCFTLYDVVRIDHFRGFDEYYSIPAGMPDAKIGEWMPGPGYELFGAIKKALGNKAVIAEDLGFLTDTVIKLVKKSGFPGMKILEFAFDSKEESNYLPHNYNSNCVVYTGTHDNDTILGWYDSASRKDKAFARDYLGVPNRKGVRLGMIRAALGSVADTAIIPMQDVLGLGPEARMNIPSTLGNNWKWRMKSDALAPEVSKELLKLNKTYGRAER